MATTKHWLDSLFYGLRYVFFGGVELPEQPAINFHGAGVRVANNANERRIDVTIDGVGAVADWEPITQLDWYVDADDGDDDATGATADTALQSFDELRRRLSAGAVDGLVGTVTIHVLADSAETIFLDVRLANDGTLLVAGSRTVLGTHAITSLTAWDDGTNAESRFTCSSIPTTLAALGAVGGVAIISGGARAGTWTMVESEPSARQALTAGWRDANYEVGAAQSGDTVQFCSLTALTGIIKVSSRGDGRVRFVDLTLGAAGEEHAVDVLSGYTQFVRCAVNGLDVESGAYASIVASLTTNGCRAFGGTIYLFSSAHNETVASAMFAHEKGVILVYEQCLVRGDAVQADTDGLVYVQGSMAILDAPTGVHVHPLGRFRTIGPLWVRSATVRGFYIEAGGLLVCDASALPEIVGTAPPNDARINGTNYAFAGATIVDDLSGILVRVA